MKNCLEVLTTCSLIAVATTAAHSQSTFEAASVKAVTLEPGRGARMTGGPGTSSPGQFSYVGATLSDLLQEAYGVLPDQISGPGWLNSERFSIVAKVPPGTTREQFGGMLQALLLDRFQLSLHHEQRELAVYELLIAKGGPKLKSSEAARLAADPNAVPQPAKSSKDDRGCPILEPGAHSLTGTFGSGLQCTSARHYSLSEIAQWLEQLVPMVSGEMFDSGVRAHVIDKTGLSGEYDFTLRFSFQPLFRGRTPAPETNDPGITLFAALEKDLGLKLEKQKLPFDILVIDHALKVPTEN